MFKQTFMVIGAALLMTSCATQMTQQGEDPIRAHIDTTVRPQDDFFEFAHGTWFKQHPIPATDTRVGIWKDIDDTIQSQIYRICLEASQSENPEGSNKQKIGDMYLSGMDSITLNSKGISDIQEYLDRIDAMKNLNELPQLAAEESAYAGTPFFRCRVGQDDMNSAQYVFSLDQGGLDLPDRRFYVDEDAKSEEIRQKFVAYIQSIFSTMGYDEAKAQASAQQVMDLETTLAKVSRKSEDLRDPFENYHKMTVAQLQKLTPAFDWTAFISSFGLEKVDSVVVGQPEFFTALNSILKKTPVEVMKDYMKFQLVDALAEYMDDDLYMKHFNFASKVLTGVEVPRPRWKRVVDNTNHALGDLVGQVYVEEFLPQGTKEKFTEIGNAIKAEFANHIKALDWMSDVTKEKALKKLDAVNMKLAYPDTWKDMSSVNISKDSYVKNMLSVRKWQHDRMVNRYGKPVDRTEWGMQPQTYNAYYSPSNNEICIPGCNIIVPGFEGMPDDAVLYGIIGGSTFGHEITHGFDDQGCNYDAIGNLNSWWTDEDKAKFNEKTKLIVKQYDEYEVVDGLHINGENTQGENIADLGGVIMGFEAFKKTQQYQDNVMIGGFTPAQRYFLAYALSWMVTFRPEALATRVKSDVHSPAKWRVLGPLSDTEEFYEAFNVKEGDQMWRPDSLRVKIW